MADVNKDYGRRHYLSDRDYQEQMRETTDFTVDSKIKLPHSEFKKPWNEEDYPTMEYGWDPPGFTPPGLPPFPDDIPDPEDPGWPDPGDPFVPGDSEGLGCLFYWPLTPGLLDPGETAYAKLARRDDPIVGITVSGPASLVSSTALLGLCTSAGQAQANSILGANPSSAECSITIKVNDKLTEEQQAETILFIDVTATTRSGATCTTSAIVNQENCVDADAVEYDDTNSPDTINAGSSALLYITDGVPPFSWSVSGGNGFSISPETTSRYNLLRASAAACGTAEITITDSCGDQATGEVRCNDNSSWHQQAGEPCLLPGYARPDDAWHWVQTAGTGYIYQQTTVTYGGKKQYERIRMTFQYVNCGDGRYFDTVGELEACQATLCTTLDPDVCLHPEQNKVWTAYQYDGDYNWCGGRMYFAEAVYSAPWWTKRGIDIDGSLTGNVSTKTGWLWECD